MSFPVWRLWFRRALRAYTSHAIKLYVYLAGEIPEADTGLLILARARVCEEAGFSLRTMSRALEELALGHHEIGKPEAPPLIEILESELGAGARVTLRLIEQRD